MSRSIKFASLTKTSACLIEAISTVQPLKTVAPSPFSAALFIALMIPLAYSIASDEGVKTSLASAT